MSGVARSRGGLGWRSPALVLAVSCWALVAGPSTPADAAQARAQPPGPAPPGFFGVSGRTTSTRDFRMMREVGVGVFRTLFHFDSAKRRAGDFYDWVRFDRIVDEAARNGLVLMPILYGAPRWLARDSSVPPVRGAAMSSEWQSLLRELASRYGPNGLYWALNPLTPRLPIRFWQVWNEPNVPNFWRGGPNPREFATLLKISTEAIRGVDPRATIVSGGIVARPQRLGAMGGGRFLTRVLQVPGMRETIDRIGYHPYGGGAREVVRHLRRARIATKRAGAGGTPIWVTEVGWSSRPRLLGLLHRNETGQARALRSTFRLIQRRRTALGLERALWYYWRDHRDPICAWCRSAGLLANDYREKPALREFDRIARAE